MAEQASKVSGVVQIDGTPAQRTVRAFGYEAQTHAIDGNEVTLSRTLGHATSDPATGEYTIDLLAGYADPIFVVAFDDYGADFTPDMALAVGDRVHPTTPNGYVWECTGAGTLPSEEPTWVVDTETAQLYGTASMIAKPFYRPMVHGPVAPEVTAAGDEFFNSVVALLHFDMENAVTDEAGRAWSVVGPAAVTQESSAKFGARGLRIQGNQSSVSTAGGILDLGDKFTIEGWVRIQSLNNSLGGATHALVAQSANKGYGDQFIALTDGKLRFGRGSAVGGGSFDERGSRVITLDKFTHWAITFDGENARGFLDGYLEFTFPCQGWVNAPGDFNIGRNLNIGFTPTGSDADFDDFRVTKGVARYTQAFIPTDKPFPNTGPA